VTAEKHKNESQSEMKVGICPGIAMFEIGNQRVDLQIMHQMWFRIFCRTWSAFYKATFSFQNVWPCKRVVL